MPISVLPLIVFALALTGVSQLHTATIEGVEPDESGPHTLKEAERSQRPQLAPASNEADKARARFQIPEGFITDTWAAEPMLANAVAFCFDRQGRIYTSETNRYRTSVLDIRHYLFMLEDDLAGRNSEDWTASIKRNFPGDWQQLGLETEVIRLLEDTDGDGKADQSRVFADGFNTILDGIASGVLEHEGTVWFTNIPNLWRLEGRGANGEAAKRESLSYGYGVRFSYTGHDMHGLILGPDGRLYFSFGDRGAHVQTQEGRTLAFPDEGAVFRCEPDGSHLEPVMRGLRNPQELAFDDHGNLFTGDNDSDQGDRERWVYVCEGGDAGWRIGWQHNPLGKERNPWLAENMWAPRTTATPFYILSPIANLPDGPSGLAYYPGTGMPERFRGHFFLCGFKGTSAKSAISTWKNEVNGAGFNLVDQEVFVDHVQATDVAFGPDSKIYMSEWGEGWERNGKGRIFRCYHPASQQAQAARVEEVKKLLFDGFTQRSVDELGNLLGHHDQRVRLEAQWALAKKSEAAQKFAQIAAKGQGLARLHGIWGLGHVARIMGHRDVKGRTGGTAESATLSPLLALLEDSDAEVRANAAKVLGDGRASEASAKLVALMKDPTPRVRYFAAQGAGKLGTKTALPALLTLARENADADQYLRHAVVIALAAIGDKAALIEAGRDPDRSVRLAALLAMHRLEMPEIAHFVSDREPSLVREAARVINDGPVPAALGELAKILDPQSTDEQLMLRVLNANFRGGKQENALALANYAAAEEAPVGLRTEALILLEQWPKPAARDRIVGVFRPIAPRDAKPAIAALKPVLPKLLTSGRIPLALQAISTATKLDMKTEAPAFAAIVQNRGADPKLRAAALQALGAFKDANLAASVRIAVADKDAALRIEALTLFGTLDPNEAATQLSTAYAGASIAEKKVILTALGGLKSPAAAQTLAQLLKTFSAQPVEALLELVEAADKRNEPEVKAALAAYQSTVATGDNLAPFLTVMAGGDRLSGEKLFKEHPIAACLRCHRVEDQGGEAGPNLSDIGKRTDRKEILESIINPNAKIAEGFQMQVITLKDGTFLTGFLKSETAEAVTILPPGAEAITLSKGDIEAREEGASGMLPNLGELLTKRQIRDLVEYCASLQK